jgi:hypothetical protein
VRRKKFDLTQAHPKNKILAKGEKYKNQLHLHNLSELPVRLAQLRLQLAAE